MRKGFSHGKPAIFKAYDLSKDPAGEEQMRQEIGIYKRLSDLQASLAAQSAVPLSGAEDSCSCAWMACPCCFMPDTRASHTKVCWLTLIMKWQLPRCESAQINASQTTCHAMPFNPDDVLGGALDGYHLTTIC